MHSPRNFRTSLVSTVLFLCAGGAIAGAQVNQPPTASFVSPTDGATINARSTVTWTGMDPDGVIIQFQYALDPPDAFTTEEISDPENSMGVVVDTLAGPDANRDTLRVSKTVNEDVFTFDWIQTPDTEEAFLFSTPNPDSVFSGILEPDDTFSGDHVMFLRALDDSAAYSPANEVAFTAVTLTPTAEITRPDIQDFDILHTGPDVLVTWVGWDPDSPSNQPVSYLYKLLRLDTLDPPINILTVSSPNILYTHGDSAWTPTDSLKADLNLATPGQYLFGVRAVDESGAEEPFLEFGRNAFKFQALENGGKPVLTIAEPILGVFEDPSSPSVEVPVGVDLHFEVLCSAEEYGGGCADWRWGLDLPDPESETGWSAWITETPFLPPLSLEVGAHVLYVEIRDDVGAVTLGSITLNTIEFPLDREVLWVDDSLDDVNPNDGQHDAFWMSLFTNSGRFEEGDVFTFDVFGPGDTGMSNPTAPTLSEMSRYKLLVWECRGSGFNGRTALLEDAGLSRLLGLYVAAGGQLWLGGRSTVAATTSVNGVSADYTYPKNMSDLPDNFALNYLKLGSTWIANDRGADVRNFIAAALAPPGQPVIYDPMDIDPDKLNPVARVYGGVANADAIFNPIDTGLISNFTGVLDTLYLYGSAGVLVQGKNSGYHNKPCAVRWQDPDPDPVHGKTQWFGFSLYFMNDMEAQGTFNRSIDWFRGDGPVPVTLSRFTAGWENDAAVLRWEVAEAGDHAGFFVHREATDGERVRLHDSLLSGRSSYEFVDADAPAAGARYWLAEVSRSGVTSWHGPRSLAPQSVAPRVLTLASAPNPFRASTDIAYSLPQRAPVLLTVYDIQGRRVATLVDATVDAGDHTVTWGGRGESGTPAASGLYFLRLRAGADTRVLKVILSR